MAGKDLELVLSIGELESFGNTLRLHNIQAALAMGRIIKTTYPWEINSYY